MPKCLIPVAGQSLMDYWLALLLEGGIERILVNTHHLAEKVRAHVAVSPWRDLIDLVHEEELLGTGGTVLHNAAEFGNEPFLVAHADNLTWFDVQAFLRAHAGRPNPQDVPITMMTFDTDDPSSCGIVERDKDGLVRAFHEKVADPPGNRANAATYIFEPTMLEHLAGLGKSVIDLSTEVLPHFVSRMATWHNSEYLRDIGNIESLRQAESDARRHPGLVSLRRV